MPTQFQEEVPARPGCATGQGDRGGDGVDAAASAAGVRAARVSELSPERWPVAQPKSGQALEPEPMVLIFMRAPS